MSVFLQPLQTIYANSGSVASILFSSIPQTYTDLVVKVSTRDTGASQHMFFDLNGTAPTGFSNTLLFGDGSSTYSQRRTDGLLTFTNETSSSTANTFNSMDFYIPNYTSSNYKQIILDSVTEQNGSGAYSNLMAILWRNTAAINSIGLGAAGTAFAQYSKFSLYGVLRQGI